MHNGPIHERELEKMQRRRREGGGGGLMAEEFRDNWVIVEPLSDCSLIYMKLSRKLEDCRFLCKSHEEPDCIALKFELLQSKQALDVGMAPA